MSWYVRHSVDMSFILIRSPHLARTRMSSLGIRNMYTSNVEPDGGNLNFC